MTHSWRRQDPDAAAAWLAGFAGLRRPLPAPAPRTLASLDLLQLDIELPRVLRVIPIDDVSDAPDDL